MVDLFVREEDYFTLEFFKFHRDPDPQSNTNPEKVYFSD